MIRICIMLLALSTSAHADLDLPSLGGGQAPPSPKARPQAIQQTARRGAAPPARETYNFFQPALYYSVGGVPSGATDFQAFNYRGARLEMRLGRTFTDSWAFALRGGGGLYSSGSVGLDTQSGQHIDLDSDSARILNAFVGLDFGIDVSFLSIWLWAGFSPFNLVSIPATAFTDAQKVTGRTISLTAEYAIARGWKLSYTWRMDLLGSARPTSASIGFGFPMRI